MILEGIYDIGGETEIRELGGLMLKQNKNRVKVSLSDFEGCDENMIIAMMTLKYTQSNSVVYVYRGQTIGIGAGQQSRIDCVKLAGLKSKIWLLRNNQDNIEKMRYKANSTRIDKINEIVKYVEDNIEMLSYRKDGDLVLGSDAFFPFTDNIDVANDFGVDIIVQPGGSIADEAVSKRCEEYGIKMYKTIGKRFFLH